MDFKNLNLNCIVLLPSGRSGSVFFQSLMDFHPNISILPSFSYKYDYYSEFKHCINTEDFIDAFLNKYKILLDPHYNPYFTHFDFTNEILTHQESFSMHAYKENFLEIAAYIPINSRKNLFIALHLALEKTIGRELSQLRYILFHFHDHNNLQELNKMLEDFPDLYLIGTARDPRESYYSCKKLLKNRGREHFLHHYWEALQYCAYFYIEFSLFSLQLLPSKVILIDLNTLHDQYKRILKEVMLWLGIDFVESILESTILGISYSGNNTGRQKLTSFSKKMIPLKYPAAIKNKEISFFELCLIEYCSREIIKNYGYSECITKVSFFRIFLELFRSVPPIYLRKKLDMTFLHAFQKGETKNPVLRFIPLKAVQILGAGYDFLILNIIPRFKDFLKSFGFIYNIFILFRAKFFVDRVKKKLKLNCTIYNRSFRILESSNGR